MAEKEKKKICKRKLIVIKIREIVRENKGRDKFECGLVRSFFFFFKLIEGMRDEIELFWIIKLSKWGVMKLVGSWKLESGVDKKDVRVKKKGRLKKQRKKKL